MVIAILSPVIVLGVLTALIVSLKVGVALGIALALFVVVRVIYERRQYRRFCTERMFHVVLGKDQK